MRQISGSFHRTFSNAIMARRSSSARAVANYQPSQLSDNRKRFAQRIKAHHKWRRRSGAAVMQKRGGRPMLRQLALASFILLTSSLVSAQTAKFQVEEATIEDIQAAILRGELTSTGVVQLYLNRIKAYNGTCVNQPDGILGAGPITPIKNARQLNALMTLNLRPAKREALEFDRRKARSMTDPVDNDPAMPDALEVAAQQDAYLASTGKLIGALHGVVFAIKDQYDTFDMRTTGGMDADYANDRPPDDATFVKRLREAGAIILAKANMGEMGTPNSRSSFGGPFCNPYDTTRTPGTSSGGSGSSVAANLVTCSIGEEPEDPYTIPRRTTTSSDWRLPRNW